MQLLLLLETSRNLYIKNNLQILMLGKSSFMLVEHILSGGYLNIIPISSDVWWVHNPISMG